MKYLALLSLGLLIACGSSNSTPMVAGSETTEEAPEIETGGGETETERSNGQETETPDNGESDTDTSEPAPADTSEPAPTDTSEPAAAGINNCGFWCDRPSAAEVIAEQDGIDLSHPRWQLMNGLPTQASSAEYQGDIEIVGGLYADSPAISDPRIRLRANFHATNSATFSRLLGRRANDQGILENVYERDEVPAKTIRGEVFVLYEGDRREIQKRPIFIDEGALTDTGTFNTFKTLDQGPDNTGMSGSFFGVSNQRFNQGVAGIVGTRFFKGTFITDNQRYHYKF